MFMSVVAQKSASQIYPELAGARVLVTGLTSALGVDVVRAFAEHKARLAIQSPEASPQMTALVGVLAESAAEVLLFNAPLADSAEAVRLVQHAAGSLGGFDAVVNLVAFGEDDIAALEAGSDPEALVAARLEALHLVTQVAANRMRLTLTEGSILNVVVVAGSGGAYAGLLADLTRAMLADLTRGHAAEWAPAGLRVNAVGPQSSIARDLNGGRDATDPDIAAIALRFASGKGRGLSGHLLEADGAAGYRC